MATLRTSWFVLFWKFFILFHATYADHEEVLQIHFPSVTLSAQKNGYLAAQTEGGGDIHINHKGNGTAVYLDDVNLIQIVNIALSLPPLWMNHTDTGYSGKFEGGKHFQIPLNVLVAGAENISFEVVAGSLPSGVSIDAANRRISGIAPDEDAQYIFTVRAKTEYGKFADAIFRFDSFEVNQCEEYPCHNNGVCNNTREGRGFTCVCVGHYGGKQCDTDCRLNSIGVGNKNIIPDAQLSAYLSRDASMATAARYHGNSSSGWCGENGNSWIQVDIGSAGRIFAVTTKAGKSDQYLQTFTMSCSLDGTHFSDVLETNSTNAYEFSSDMAGLTQPLPEPASCRFVRLHPKNYKAHPCLMLELHGCVP